MEEARERIKSGAMIKDTEGFHEDEKGRPFQDVSKFVSQENDVKRNIALKRHGNDFNKRLDECQFPYDRKDRLFISSHNFGENLSTIMSNIRRSWIYIYGDPGRGKTSLATRAVWEMIKNYPEREATFLSIGKWVKSLQPDNPEYVDISKMKKIVLIDDFDKFDKQKDFQIRQLLLLIEELKNRHIVIITANHAIDQIADSNKNSLDLEVMIDRVRGKSVILERFEGESYR
jgi:DNA replication protein DnaC